MPTKKPVETVVLSIRVPAKVKARLEKLAKLSGRSKSWHAAEALDGYVRYQTPIVESIREAQAQGRRGEVTPHDEVFARLDARIAAMARKAAAKKA